MCSKCAEKLENDFVIVRKYLQKHAGAGIKEIEEDTGVDEQNIIQFMREGRFIAEGVSGILKCDNCGISIKEGRYCEQCLYDINRTLQSVMPVTEASRVKQNTRSIKRTMYSREKPGQMGNNK